MIPSGTDTPRSSGLETFSDSFEIETVSEDEKDVIVKTAIIAIATPILASTYFKFKSFKIRSQNIKEFFQIMKRFFVN